jgi:hypothetical protein
MFQLWPQFRLNVFFEKKSIALEYALARKWARAHPLEVLDKERPTVGEMVPPSKKPAN